MILLCPNSECKAHLMVEKEMFGKTIRCPECQKTITLKTYKRAPQSVKPAVSDELKRRKAIAFFKALLDGNTVAINTLLNFSPKLIFVKDNHGRLPIHLAALKGHVEVIEILLSKGADIESLDLQRRTPMHFAAESGSIPVLEYLLAKGANINIEDKKRKTPKDIANMNGHGDVIEFIKKHT